MGISVKQKHTTPLVFLLKYLQQQGSVCLNEHLSIELNPNTTTNLELKLQYLNNMTLLSDR